uniref:Uncharacterized protein n=1 Tax=Opuntia streptacantha TaxID=393608 RepID=A0A7C9AR86_OPUST
MKFYALGKDVLTLVSNRLLTLLHFLQEEQHVQHLKDMLKITKSSYLLVSAPEVASTMSPLLRESYSRSCLIAFWMLHTILQRRQTCFTLLLSKPNMRTIDTRNQRSSPRHLRNM